MMKVIQSIEALYGERRVIYDKLAKRVDGIFNDIKHRNWHYVSRVKKPESFALKLETGRFSDASLEDFFACTLVVENLDQINKATELIEQYFDIADRRPRQPTITHKDASSFQFDDLRLYVRIKEKENLPPEPINKLLFEIQIKTFLQHAWAIATHDLIYKTDEINWAKQRVAFQIKAMLEQTELTISGVNNLIGLPEIAKDSYETSKLKEILQFYSDSFDREELPLDVVRLCQNTKELMRALQLELSDIRQIIDDEMKQGRGPKLKNLSPFLLIIQSIINQRKEVIEKFLNGKENKYFKLVLPKEINASSMSITRQQNIVRLEILPPTKTDSIDADQAVAE